MTRFDLLNDRYAATAAVAMRGVEMLIVAEPAGAHLDAVIKELLMLFRMDGPELWGDVLSVARQLRWRLATEPQPTIQNPQLQDIARAVVAQSERLRPVVGAESGQVLQRLADAAEMVGHSDPNVGAVLLRSLREIGSESCVVITASSRAAAGLTRWFYESGIRTPVVSGTQRNGSEVVDQAYAVGPPRVFPASVVTAPWGHGLTFLFPSWETNRTLTLSVVAQYAEGAIRPRNRVFKEGIDPVLETPAPDIADDLVPMPIWTQPSTANRTPGDDEVMARRVLLSGGLAMYLETDGEHIRSLDPAQPQGERVTFSHLETVGPGTFLVLREGQAEREALYDRAVMLLGDRGPAAERSQQHWKEGLQRKLRNLGRSEVSRQLQEAGVRRHTRAVDWIERTLARPQDTHDFELLLRWLDIPPYPTIELATELRRQRMKASVDVRESLEDALSAASMTKLKEAGHLRLDLELPGFRGIIATRVLAISPHTEPVGRNDVRIPELDRSAQWLE